MLPAGASQRAIDVMLRSWLLEMLIAGAAAAGGAERCEAGVAWAKFVKLDCPTSVNGLTEGGLRYLKLGELLSVVPATCLPYDTGSLASEGYVSVELRSTFGKEVLVDVACMQVSPAFLGKPTES